MGKRGSFGNNRSFRKKVEIVGERPRKHVFYFGTSLVEDLGTDDHGFLQRVKQQRYPGLQSSSTSSEIDVNTGLELIRYGETYKKATLPMAVVDEKIKELYGVNTRISSVRFSAFTGEDSELLLIAGWLDDNGNLRVELDKRKIKTFRRVGDNAIASTIYIPANVIQHADIRVYVYYTEERVDPLRNNSILI